MTTDLFVEVASRVEASVADRRSSETIEVELVSKIESESPDRFTIDVEVHFA